MKNTQIIMRNYPNLLILIFLSFFINACSSPKEENSATISLSLPSQFKAKPGISSRAFSNAEFNFESLIVTILRDDIESIVDSVDLLNTGNQTTTVKVPAQTSLTVIGEAFKGGLLQYRGEVNDIILKAGEKKQLKLPLNSSILIDIGINNAPANGNLNKGLAFSNDNQFVLFASNSDNLVENDNNDANDIFLRDLSLSTTTNVNSDKTGAIALSSNISQADISADGSYVVFASDSADYLPADINQLEDIYLKNVITNEITHISKGVDNIFLDVASTNPQISDDGTIITYYSEASTYNDGTGIYLYNRLLAQPIPQRIANSSNKFALSGDGNSIVYIDSDGYLNHYNISTKKETLINDDPGEINFNVSQNGEFVIFSIPNPPLSSESDINSDQRSSISARAVAESDLEPGQVYRYSLADKLFEHVSKSAIGTKLVGDLDTAAPNVSNNGNFAVFGYDNKVYVKNITTGRLSKITNGDSVFISADGKKIGYNFESHIYIIDNPLYLEQVIVDTKPTTPTTLTVESFGSYFKLSWLAVDNAKYYRVYQRYEREQDEGETQTVTEIYETTELSIIADKNISANIDYQFSVSAINDGGQSIISDKIVATYELDLTPPSVIDLVPTVNSANVDIDSPFRITFSEPITESSLSIDPIYINYDGEGIIFGTMDLNTNKNIVTFQPSGSLPYNTQIILYVPNSITDLSGNVLDQEYSFTFNTRPVVIDNDAPAVENILPADGEEFVPVDSNIVINFSEAINAASVNTNSISLSANGFAVTAANLSTLNNTVTYNPSLDLTAGTTYLLTINTAITDLAGNNLTQEFTSQFTTLVEHPVLISHFPENNQVEVPRETVVKINFSEVISVANPDIAFKVTDSAGNNVIGSHNIVSSIYNFIPSGAFLANERYRVDVFGQEVLDLDGNSLDSDYTFFFETVKPPIVVSHIPEINATNVPLNTPISFTLSDNTTTYTTFSDLIELRDLSGNLIPLTNQTITGTTVTAFLINDLNEGETYNATFNNNAFSSTGVQMENDFSFEFTAGNTILANAEGSAGQPVDITQFPSYDGFVDTSISYYQINFGSSTTDIPIVWLENYSEPVMLFYSLSPLTSFDIGIAIPCDNNACILPEGTSTVYLAVDGIETNNGGTYTIRSGFPQIASTSSVNVATGLVSFQAPGDINHILVNGLTAGSQYHISIPDLGDASLTLKSMQTGEPCTLSEFVGSTNLVCEFHASFNNSILLEITGNNIVNLPFSKTIDIKKIIQTASPSMATSNQVQFYKFFGLTPNVPHAVNLSLPATVVGAGDVNMKHHYRVFTSNWQQRACMGISTPNNETQACVAIPDNNGILYIDMVIDDPSLNGSISIASLAAGNSIVQIDEFIEGNVGINGVIGGVHYLELSGLPGTFDYTLSLRAINTVSTGAILSVYSNNWAQKTCERYHDFDVATCESNPGNNGGKTFMTLSYPVIDATPPTFELLSGTLNPTALTHTIPATSATLNVSPSEYVSISGLSGSSIYAVTLTNYSSADPNRVLPGLDVFTDNWITPACLSFETSNINSICLANITGSISDGQLNLVAYDELDAVPSHTSDLTVTEVSTTEIGGNLPYSEPGAGLTEFFKVYKVSNLVKYSTKEIIASINNNLPTANNFYVVSGNLDKLLCEGIPINSSDNACTTVIPTTEIYIVMDLSGLQTNYTYTIDVKDAGPG